MREILVVNPQRKKAATGGGKAKKMAKKKRKRKRAARSPAKRRRVNPRRRRSTARRYGSRMLGGLSLRSALKDQVPIQIGMLAAQWGAKRFGPDASELDPTSWNWSSYAKGALGSFAAAMAANAIKPGLGQKVLTGGISHVVHRLVRNELIEKSPWAVTQFGQGDQEEEGIYVDEEGTPYAAGVGEEMLPLDEQHRMLPSGSVMGDTLVEPGPLGVGQLEPVGPLGDTTFQRYAKAYAE